LRAKIVRKRTSYNELRFVVPELNRLRQRPTRRAAQKAKENTNKTGLNEFFPKYKNSEFEQNYANNRELRKSQQSHLCFPKISDYMGNSVQSPVVRTVFQPILEV